MSITLHQQPTSPNMANADLLYVVTSTTSSAAQFQFVCDIKDENNTLIQRLKQQPNPSGKGVFNIGQVLLTQLEVDPIWKVQAVTGSVQSAKSFKVLFGEEYADNLFGNVYTYNGIVNNVTGSPALSGSSYYYDVNGLVEPNSGYWNFQSSSYYTEVATPQLGTGTFNKGLTSSPRTLYIQEGDYHTVSLFNGNLSGDANSSTVVQDVYMMNVTTYDGLNGTGNQIDTYDIYNITANGGFRDNISQQWVNVYTSQSDASRLQHWGVGYQNLLDHNPTIDFTGWNSYVINWYPQQSPGNANTNYVLDTFIFNKSTGNCDYNTVRFAWKNELGTWDYYNFTLAESETNSMERIEYRQTFVPFSTNTNSATYDISRRGRDQLLNKITTTKTVNSDWLTQTEADWIQELFLTNNVYIQDGSDFVPVVVVDSAVVAKRNPRTQKNFQYVITYQLANNKRQRQ